MRPAEISALRARWETPEGRELALTAARWLAGASARPTGLGVIDGRVDLRGLQFPDAVRVGSFQTGRLSFQSIAGMPEFTGVEWRDVDLSGAVIRHARFFHASIVGCRFDSAELEDWRLWNSAVSSSSFVGADLRDSALGTGEYEGGINRWVGVDFDRANLTGAHFSVSTMHRCSFRNAKLKKTSFNHLDIADVVFEGLLDSVQFEGLALPRRPQGVYWMRNVDFSGAMFRNGLLRGYRMRDVKLPAGVLYIPDFPRVLEHAEELVTDARDDIRRWIEGDRRLVELASTRCWDDVFFTSDLIAQGSDERSAILQDVYERAIALTPSQPCADEDEPPRSAGPRRSILPWKRRDA